MRTLFLFDLDDTLLHCNGAEKRALGATCEALFGTNCLPSVSFGGKTHLAILEEIFLAHGKQAPRLEQIVQLEAMYYSLFETEIRPTGVVEKLPDADATLTLCQTHGLVGVATGNSRVGAHMKLGRLNWRDKFTVGAFGCLSKDRVALIRDARKQAEQHSDQRFANADVWVIGDTPLDVAAARQAGVVSIGIATGDFSVEALLRSGADEAYPNLKTWTSRF